MDNPQNDPSYNTGAKIADWVKAHKVWTAVGVLAVLFVVGAAVGGSDDSQDTAATTTTFVPIETTESPMDTIVVETTAAPVVEETTTTVAETTTTAAPTTTTTADLLSNEEVAELAFWITISDTYPFESEFYGREDTIGLAKALCADFDANGGPDVTQMVGIAQLADENNISYEFVGGVMGAGSAAFCPQHSDALLELFEPFTS